MGRSYLDTEEDAPSLERELVRARGGVQVKPTIWACGRCSWSTTEPFSGLGHAVAKHGVDVNDWSGFLETGRYVDVVCPLCRGDGPVGQPTRYQNATCPTCLGRGYVDRRELKT